MLKTILVASVLVGTSTLAVDADAATAYHKHRHHRVLANGRCNGVSYGTGARSCGTATGGPVGGNSSRN